MATKVKRPLMVLDSVKVLMDNLPEDTTIKTYRRKHAPTNGWFWFAHLKSSATHYELFYALIGSGAHFSSGGTMGKVECTIKFGNTVYPDIT